MKCSQVRSCIRIC